MISSGGDTNHLKWLTREHFRTLEKRRPIKTYYFPKLVTKYSDYQEVIDGKLFFFDERKSRKFLVAINNKIIRGEPQINLQI